MTKLKFNLTSGMFNVWQPGTDGMEEEFSAKENFENDGYQEQLEEKINGVRRRDLPKNHVEYIEDGYFELNHQKYLKRILAPTWVDAFNEILKGRDESIKVEAKLTGTWSPREYNFTTDRALFDVLLSKRDLKKIEKAVLPKYESVFGDFLKIANSNINGPIWWLPQNVEMWWRYYARQEEYGRCRVDATNCSNAVSNLLEFWLFAFDLDDLTKSPSLKMLDKNQWDFRDVFNEEMEYYTCNGYESDCYDFYPKGSKEYEYIMQYYQPEALCR